MKLIFRAFKANSNLMLCEKFLFGHQQVLVDYGITNITTNNNDWMRLDSVYCIVIEKEDGTVVAGIRTHIADGINLLPVEKAIGKFDSKIHDIISSYKNEGVGELCALWNAKELAGMGLSIMLVRAGISMTNQLACRTLIGIGAEYTLKMFNKVGFIVNNDLGDNGKFVYPNENYVARVLGILNANDLATAEEFDRIEMKKLREKPVQTNSVKGPNNNVFVIEYNLLL